MQRWSHHRKATPSSSEKSALNGRLFNPTPEELRKLVLDYLCHNSYASAASALIRDSTVKHLDADGDDLMESAERADVDELGATLEDMLALSELRKEIRDLILSGKVDEATTMLNRHFPQVLDEDNKPPEDDEDGSPSDKFAYIPSTSVDPTHLVINLRIQAFIEAARCIPLPFPKAECDPSPGCPCSSYSSSSFNDPVDSESARQAELLHRAQNLYSAVNCLKKATDRALFITELSQISGLLAYPNPESSPMAIYLAPERREAVAEQIDSAILFRVKQHTIPIIELYTRYTTSIWSIANELGVRTPPVAKWPTGVHLPPSAQGLKQTKHIDPPNDSNVPVKKVNAEKDVCETVPPFDLLQFLNAKS